MSRRRDINWTKDEITVLFDSITEITKARLNAGKKTGSREVFEYAAVKLGESGHTMRAEKEKCRTKWKKMKEEYSHAKRARAGDSNYREAPGITAFYDRMEAFMDGNYDSLIPNSTTLPRSSSVSSSNQTNSSNSYKPALGSRTSARLAANTASCEGSANTNTNDTSSTTTEQNRTDSAQNSATGTGSNQMNVASRQNAARLPPSGNSSNNLFLPVTNNPPTNQNHQHSHNQHQSQQQNDCELSTINTLSNFAAIGSNNCPLNGTGGDLVAHHLQLVEHADISYRVSTGCRQITIFGDHDVDIKFRGDCVTINKIGDMTTMPQMLKPSERIDQNVG